MHWMSGLTPKPTQPVRVFVIFEDNSFQPSYLIAYISHLIRLAFPVKHMPRCIIECFKGLSVLGVAATK